MSKQRSVFEINGNTYYSPKAAADNWKMTHQAVTSACKEGRIVGAFQDSTNRWCIPNIAMKPLDKETIRKIMLITLALKNSPNITISGLENYDISKLYSYLRDTNYIKPFDDNSKRIPYEAILTEKGMNLVIENKKIDVDWANVAVLLVQCIPSFLEIGAALLH